MQDALDAETANIALLWRGRGSSACIHAGTRVLWYACPNPFAKNHSRNICGVRRYVLAVVVDVRVALYCVGVNAAMMNAGGDAR